MGYFWRWKRHPWKTRGTCPLMTRIRMKYGDSCLFGPSSSLSQKIRRILPPPAACLQPGRAIQVCSFAAILVVVDDGPGGDEHGLLDHQVRGHTREKENGVVFHLELYDPGKHRGQDHQEEKRMHPEAANVLTTAALFGMSTLNRKMKKDAEQESGARCAP